MFAQLQPGFSVRAVRHGEASSRFSSSFSGRVSEEKNLELSFRLYLLETQIIIYEKMCSKGDFRLSPQSRRELRSSGMLRSE